MEQKNDDELLKEDLEKRDLDFDDDQMYRVIHETSKPMGVLKRFLSLFFSPVKLMENIAQHQKFISPIIIIALVLGISLPFVFKSSIILLEEQSLIFVERYGTKFLDITKPQDASVGFGYLQHAITFFTSLFGTIFGAALGAILLKILTVIFRGKATFTQYFSMSLHTSILTAIGGVIYLITISQFRTSINFLSLAAVIMPEGNITMPSYNVLSAISLFSIWTYILIFIGVKTFNRFGVVKTILIVLISFILSIIFAAISAYIVVWTYDLTFGTMRTMIP